MGKKACILVFLALLAAGCANIMNNQLVRDDSEKRTEFIVDYPGLETSLLFSRTLKAMGLVFRSSENVIDVEDREAGNIIGNGTASFKTKCEGGVYSNLAISVRYKIIITVKDEKIRYRYVPTIEEIGGLKRTDSPSYEKIFDHMSEAQCFWVEMSNYFSTVTDELVKQTKNEDDF